MIRHNSLSRQFAGAAAALVAVAVLFISVGTWWWIDRLNQASVRALAQRDLELRAVRVRDSLVQIDERLREIAASPLLQSALTDSFGREAYLLPYLGSIQAINSVPVELLLVDFQGTEMARNVDVSFSPLERARLMQKLAEGHTSAFREVTPAGDDLLFSVAVRYQRSNTVEGALWARLPLGNLLRDPGHQLLGEHPTPSDVQSAKAGAILPWAQVELPPALSGLNLAVQRTTPVPTATAGRAASAIVVGAAALLLMGAVGLLGRFLARRLTEDLRALEQFAGTAAARSFGSARAPETGAAEVASLAQSLNRMLDQLNQQHDSLKDTAREQLHLLATCISNLNDVIMITEGTVQEDGSHRIVFVNDAFTRLTGYTSDEVIGRSPRMLQGPLTGRSELSRVAAALRAWQPVRAEVINYRKDGSQFWVEMDIVPVKDASGWVTHWVSVERDTTARREAAEVHAALEAQVREAQKSEAIATLAAGIAHDFNNILAAILGNLALARQDSAQGMPNNDRLVQIERSAGRARALVQQILTYSRRQDRTLQRAPEDLKGLLDETLSLLRATVPARVHLHSDACQRAVVVMGDGVALQQVLMNLGTNAWHALQGSTGDVTFGIDIVDIRSPDTTSGALFVTPRGNAAVPPVLPAFTALAAGPYAWLTVSDNGCGMDTATQSRIFEPFFTTKAAGSGTGLGLSVVHGIVREHGGAIGVVSAPGQGTVFHILLPLSSATPAAHNTEPAMAPRTGQGQSVLYVDDDEVVGTVAAGLLEGWGYRVTSLRCAADAIAAVVAEPRRFALVVTDYNMPDLSGLDVLRALRKLRADLPIVLTSGYLSEDTRSEAMAAGAFAVVRKENLQDELPGVAARALQRS